MRYTSNRCSDPAFKGLLNIHHCSSEAAALCIYLQCSAKISFQAVVQHLEQWFLCSLQFPG